MNHPIIDNLAQLEFFAAKQFWNSEDRSAWKEDLLRQSEAHELLSLKKFIPTISSENKNSSVPIPVFPVSIWDHDLRQFFVKKSDPLHAPEESDHFQIILDRLSSCNQGTAVGLMLRPGFWMTDLWTQEEERLRCALRAARDKQAFVFRMGFFQHQADILLTADLGFKGIQIHAGQLDLYELQIAIELARDCKLCPIVSVSSDAEMEVVVQTDAPHIALCHFPVEGQQSLLPFIQKVLPKIPDNCTCTLLTAGRSTSEIQLLARLGFQAVIHCGAELGSDL